jgi:hypothetical protein
MGGLISHIRRDSSKKQNGAKNVDQLIINFHTEESLLILDTLKKMSDRQALLTEELSKKKIRSDLLLNIQKELIKEWKNKSNSLGSNSPQDEIINITLDTTRTLGLHNNTFSEGDLQFMLKIGWKFAQYNIGLTQELEADDQYPAIKTQLVKQMNSITSEKINNVLTAYLNYSFAMNSGYLFSSYLSAKAKMKKMLHQNLSPSRIKYLRDTGLESLLTYSQGLVEDISKR